MAMYPISLKAFGPSTSTGVGTNYLKGVFTQAAMQVKRTSTGTATYQLEGTINPDSTTWHAISATATGATNATTLTKSTMTFCVSQIRVRCTANSAPGAVTVWISGS